MNGTWGKSGVAGTARIRGRERFGSLWALVAALALCSQPASAQSRPLTEAEEASWARTTSHAGVVSFLYEVQSSSDKMLVREIGRTEQDRSILAVFLGDPVTASPEATEGADKPTVLITGSIHGDEPVGREGALQLIRDLALGDSQDLLRTVNVIVVPEMNPDGAEAGTRANARGYDLNRDWVTAETPEVSAVLERIVTRFWPDVFLDVHNGGSPPYHLTFQATLEPAADSDLVSLTRGPVFDYIKDRLEKSGMAMYWYSGPAFDQRWGSWYWRTTDPWPRKQHSYAGLRDMMAILFEIPPEHPPAVGVEAARTGMLGLIEFVSRHPEEVRGAVREARRRTLEEPLREVYLELGAQAYPEKDEFFVPAPDGAGGPVRNRLVEGENRTRYVPVRTRPVPWGYVFDSRMTDLAALLQRHGVQVERILRPVTVPAERYRVLEIARSEERYQHHRLTDVHVNLDTGSVELEAGWYLVRVQQPAGRLIPQLLEPDAVDSLVRWNFLDGYLPAPGLDAYLPLYRLAVRPATPAALLP